MKVLKNLNPVLLLILIISILIIVYFIFNKNNKVENFRWRKRPKFNWTPTIDWRTEHQRRNREKKILQEEIANLKVQLRSEKNQKNKLLVEEKKIIKELNQAERRGQADVRRLFQKERTIVRQEIEYLTDHIKYIQYKLTEAQRRMANLEMRGK